MGEPQQVEGFRAAGIPVPVVGFAKPHQSCLFRVNLKAVPCESLRQHVLHTQCILLIGEADDKIIGIPDQIRPTAQTWLNFFLNHVSST